MEAFLLDQALGDALIVIELEARRHLAPIGQERRRLDVEPIGRRPGDAGGDIAPPGARPEILSRAATQVEIRIDRVAEEELEFGLVHRAAARRGALGGELQPVDIPAGPRLGVPAQTIAAAPNLIFGEVDHQHRGPHPAMLRVERAPCRRHRRRIVETVRRMVGRRRRGRRRRGGCGRGWGRGRGRGRGHRHAGHRHAGHRLAGRARGDARDERDEHGRRPPHAAATSRRTLTT